MLKVQVFIRFNFRNFEQLDIDVYLNDFAWIFFFKSYMYYYVPAFPVCVGFLFQFMKDLHVLSLLFFLHCLEISFFIFMNPEKSFYFTP